MHENAATARLIARVSRLTATDVHRLRAHLSLSTRASDGIAAMQTPGVYVDCILTPTATGAMLTLFKECWRNAPVEMDQA